MTIKLERYHTYHRLPIAIECKEFRENYPGLKAINTLTDNIETFLNIADREQLILSLCGGNLKERLENEWKSKDTLATLMLLEYKQKLREDYNKLLTNNRPISLIHDEMRGFCYTAVKSKENIFPKFIIIYTQQEKSNIKDTNTSSNASFNGEIENEWFIIKLKMLSQSKFPNMDNYQSIINGKYDEEILHELIHLIDYEEQKKNKRLYNWNTPESLKNYFNTTHEHNAHGAELLRRLENLSNNEIDRVLEEFKNKGQDLDEEFITVILNKVIEQMPKNQVTTYISYIKLLNEENLKDLYSSVLNIIREKMP